MVYGILAQLLSNNNTGTENLYFQTNRMTIKAIKKSRLHNLEKKNSTENISQDNNYSTMSACVILLKRRWKLYQEEQASASMLLAMSKLRRHTA